MAVLAEIRRIGSDALAWAAQASLRKKADTDSLGRFVWCRFPDEVPNGHAALWIAARNGNAIAKIKSLRTP